MSARCRLCDGGCATRFSVDGYDIARCGRCDLEFVWPTPPPVAVRAVYDDGYFTAGRFGYDDYFGRERAVAHRKAQTRLERLAALGLRAGRVLDVGCAAGYFLEVAQQQGWSVEGVERSAEARTHAPDAVRGAIRESADGLSGAFDAITFWDVLEHLDAPDEALRQYAKLLAPDGVLGIVVPVLGNVNTRLAPRTWDQYKPPEHLWYFSPRAMRAMLAAQGFRVVHEEPAWTRRSRFVDPDARRTGLGWRALRGAEALLFEGIARLGGAALRVDSVAFYARRATA
ncbi:MAG: class I SAM-dependent methyltransferase [Polyangiales bacterium]